MSNTKVTQLPPTLGVKDPDVRNFLDALVNAWDHRSGNTDAESEDRFITAREFGDLATNAVLNTLASAIPGGSVTPGIQPVTPGNVGTIITSLSDEIKKSILYELLGTEFETINVSELRTRINNAFSLAESYLKDTNAVIANEAIARENGDSALTYTLSLQASRIGDAEALITEEANTRSSQYQATTQTLSTQASRIGTVEGAITSEASTRVNKDNALAATVNRIWAAIGNNGAGIEDGQLAAVSPVASQATKWNTLQAEVIDPNTGVSRVASLRTDFTSYADRTDGTLRSVYSVRVQSTTGSPARTVVGGFGLALTQSGDAGPTIDFGVRADKFWVGSISGQGDLPFVVLTAPTSVNGAVRPAGTYIKDAFIGTAAIGTLQVAGGSVTSMSYGSGGGQGISAGGSVVGCSCSLQMPAGSTGVVIVANATTGPSGTDQASGYLSIVRSDGAQLGFTAYSMVQSSQFSAVVTGFDSSPPPNGASYSLVISNPSSGPGGNRAMSVQTCAIIATGGKR